ncbi:MAG: MFS transporter [Firmicutes bacterium]|nr:MFS transporter [Bacillota bacterium]
MRKFGKGSWRPTAIVGRLKHVFSLGLCAWKGAAYLLLATGATVWFGTFISSSPGSIHGWLVNLSLAVLIGVLSILLGHLIVILLVQFQKIPVLYRWVFVGTVILLFNLLKPSILLLINVFGTLLFLVAASSLGGAGIGALVDRRLEAAKRRVAVGLLLLGGLGLMVAASWFFWEGPRYRLPDFVEEYLVVSWQHGLDNPADTGPYPVLALTYGSGSDRRRREYGEDVGIRTDPVDVSPMVRGGGGITGWLRKKFWGFDLTEVPLNARVWYPEGDGPFPLVLVVHGNHAMDDFSDLGYVYLGELLASRGFIVASVDQNFMNGAGFVEVILGGLKEENDARGYLLLEHLALWHRWNLTEGHIFGNMIDTENIGLIGHSRGGEGAAIAAAFNFLPAHPDDAALRFDFGFNIRAVVSIAPSDGQYQLRKGYTPLENISYLVLQGAADADVRSFAGANQYDRVSFSDGEDHFKAAVYVYGANHGQFNTSWGRVDLAAARWFLNRGDIMPAEEQKTLAEVFISSFLEASLHGNGEYKQLFYNPLFGGNWLPAGIYLPQYNSSGTQHIANFEEDINLETATLPDGRLKGVNLATWREEPPTMGGGLRDAVGVRLGWDHERLGLASYSLQLPEGFVLDPEGSGLLTFAVANALRGQEPLDFTIMITDRAGEEADLPLSSISRLPPALPYRMFKPPLQISFESEPVYTTYSFQLADFLAENGDVDLGKLAQISFFFDRSPRGDIFLDDIGFR